MPTHLNSRDLVIVSLPATILLNLNLNLNSSSWRSLRSPTQRSQSFGARVNSTTLLWNASFKEGIAVRPVLQRYGVSSNAALNFVRRCPVFSVNTSQQP